jgi:hypothetical protein
MMMLLLLLMFAHKDHSSLILVVTAAVTRKKQKHPTICSVCAAVMRPRPSPILVKSNAPQQLQ